MEHLDGLGYGAFDAQRGRFDERMKFLPVAYVVLAQLMLGWIYLSHHISPLLKAVGSESELRGLLQLSVFVPTTVLMLISYVRSILTHPGEIPEDPQWESSRIPWRQEPMKAAHFEETKRSGERRHCKWCGKFKPDRCHHCRVCRICILKMDHHCPWIYNCVGFYNYKFFILLLFYAAIDCNLILWTMTESVLRCVYHVNTPFRDMFFIFFAEFLTLVFAVLVSLFLSMHLWMISHGLTTIEFCEKILPKDGKSVSGHSTYDLGLLANFQAALGQNVFLWLLPMGGPEGDGLAFLRNKNSKELESESPCAKSQASEARSLDRPIWPSYEAADEASRPTES